MIKIPKRHRFMTGLALSMASVVLTVLILLALDIFARSRVERSAGTNWQGYRGPVVAMKEPGEVRIAVLGGSTAFGYGVTAEGAFPAYLERLLSARLNEFGGRVRKVTVLNLAYNNESAVCFDSTLKSYAYLEPDVVLLYSGINDGAGISYYRKLEGCHRNKSIIFRLTGYLPILHVVIREKYFQLRYGTVEQGYRRWGEHNRRRVVTEGPTLLAEDELKEAGYRRYDRHITRLIDKVLVQDKAALFFTQPYFDTGTYREWQQDRLRRALKRKYSEVSRFRYVTLGELFRRKADQEITWDRMHLTEKGNERVAQALMEPCLELVGYLSSR